RLYRRLAQTGNYGTTAPGHRLGTPRCSWFFAHVGGPVALARWSVQPDVVRSIDLGSSHPTARSHTHRRLGTSPCTSGQSEWIALGWLGQSTVVCTRVEGLAGQRPPAR